MENPFKYGGIVRGAHFADRKGEMIEDLLPPIWISMPIPMYEVLLQLLLT